MVIGRRLSITITSALKLKRALKVVEKTLMRGFVGLECILTRLCQKRPGRGGEERSTTPVDKGPTICPRGPPMARMSDPVTP